MLREVRMAGESGAEPTTISYAVVACGLPAEPTTLDAYVFAVLLHAMTNATSLTVHGTLSRSAMLNLDEFQSCWTLWRPQRYRRIDIKPERVIDLPRTAKPRSAIAAFSGGSDSSFTLLRHKKRLLNGPHRDIGAAAIVHGFDVSLANADHLEKLIESRRPFLDYVGSKLMIVRTNVRELGLQNWEDGHGAMLASCLHQFAGRFDCGLISSSNAYHELEIPWGSNPITDPLLSGDQFEIVHEGAAFRKIEKMALLVRHPEAIQGMRVCYEGKDQYRNCGTCGKCVRARLAFLALGMPEPPCFDGPLDLAAIDTLQTRTMLDYHRLNALVDYAERRGETGEWLRRAKRRLVAHERKLRLLGARERIAARGISMLKGLGLEGRIKRRLRHLGVQN